MSISVEIPTAVPTSTVELAPPSPPPAGEQNASVQPSAVQGIDPWIENFQKYEATLQEVTKVSAEAKFKAELGTIEQWFKVLSEAERTASVYTLLLYSNQDQIRFFMSVLQQMIRPEVVKPENSTVDEQTKPKHGTRSIRPPSLNLPLPGSPTTPRFNTPVIMKDSAAFLTASEKGADSRMPSDQDVIGALQNLRTSLSQKNDDDIDKNTGNANLETLEGMSRLPGLGMTNPFHLNMLANAGLSTEAQLLAVQLVMSGLVQPTSATIPPTPSRQPAAQSQRKTSQAGESKNWRTPTSARYPGSALRNSGLRSTALKSAGLQSAGFQRSGLKSAGVQGFGLKNPDPQGAGLLSAGLKSSGLDSASSLGSLSTPLEEDFDPELLNDIPTWLRSLRLHKYTSSFEGLTWQQMVVLDDATLESKGIAALGARRRLLRTFEQVRTRMGIEHPPSSAAQTTSETAPPTSTSKLDPPAPRGASPSSKLSVDSPVFIPAAERDPLEAAPTVAISSLIASPSA